ncbi:flagellar export protein FliJ [Pedomonas mirosovicensis]|uniref:flagellar export protein FliJ n=1 Tax=Pedomonas mirosovicensis TaxID=2908641 RepID=UPI0021673541|nr:flagellar FliJ family protein [Pedomonas mirosovicensis]MCH8685897.1 flagellar FliJ family protein [Pedomonas mirosovicensis]
MKTPYDAGLRLRKNELDELRREIGALYAKQDALEGKLKAIDGEIASEAQLGLPEALVGLSDFGAYLGRQRLARHQVEQEMAKLQAEMDKLQEKLAEAFADFKTLDIASARFIENAKKEADRLEQLEADEAALMRFTPPE